MKVWADQTLQLPEGVTGLRKLRWSAAKLSARSPSLAARRERLRDAGHLRLHQRSPLCGQRESNYVNALMLTLRDKVGQLCEAQGWRNVILSLLKEKKIIIFAQLKTSIIYVDLID